MGVCQPLSCLRHIKIEGYMCVFHLRIQNTEVAARNSWCHGHGAILSSTNHLMQQEINKVIQRTNDRKVISAMPEEFRESHVLSPKVLVRSCKGSVKEENRHYLSVSYV